MLTQEQIQAIKSPFPPEALSKDTSRGFELTSIKAAFVIERLNDVFGPCGVGWRYVHSPFEMAQANSGKIEIVTEVALQYRFNASNDCTGCDQVVWDVQANDWAFRKGASNNDWSEPIFACGGKMAGGGSAPTTDARKSAVTDGLTKAASMLGIGHNVFKGQVRASGNNGRGPARSNGKGGGQRKADANAFWALYNTQGKTANVPIEAAQKLAAKGNWAAAYKELRTLIARPKS